MNQVFIGAMALLCATGIWWAAIADTGELRVAGIAVALCGGTGAIAGMLDRKRR